MIHRTLRALALAAPVFFSRILLLSLTLAPLCCATLPFTPPCLTASRRKRTSRACSRCPIIIRSGRSPPTASPPCQTPAPSIRSRWFLPARSSSRQPSSSSSPTSRIPPRPTITTGSHPPRLASASAYLTPTSPPSPPGSRPRGSSSIGSHPAGSSSASAAPPRPLSIVPSRRSCAPTASTASRACRSLQIRRFPRPSRRSSPPSAASIPLMSSPSTSPSPLSRRPRRFPLPAPLTTSARPTSPPSTTCRTSTDPASPSASLGALAPIPPTLTTSSPSSDMDSLTPPRLCPQHSEALIPGRRTRRLPPPLCLPSSSPRPPSTCCAPAPLRISRICSSSSLPWQAAASGQTRSTSSTPLRSRRRS